ncbi:hypothetical protein JMJ35_001480 [Cladonia borealis]|uniref:Uncharacterized protein n=1 Tax=Cladonia borealis TaxID=184061 RepID=A0AA39R7C6_9LECA|nr:hypothetical protein JMJ35_001480 [Cladonia borealis]
MLARAAGRPKLALAVPTINTAAAASKSAARSPLPRTPISPSPISPTIRNTRLNQRGFSTMQPPTFAYSQTSNTKSILKKGQSSSSSMAANKKLSFKEEPSVRCVSPVPEDYHGTYLKMSRDERRWGKGNGYRE